MALKYYPMSWRAFPKMAWEQSVICKKCNTIWLRSEVQTEWQMLTLKPWQLISLMLQLSRKDGFDRHGLLLDSSSDDEQPSPFAQSSQDGDSDENRVLTDCDKIMDFYFCHDVLMKNQAQEQMEHNKTEIVHNALDPEWEPEGVQKDHEPCDENYVLPACNKRAAKIINTVKKCIIPHSGKSVAHTLVIRAVALMPMCLKTRNKLWLHTKVGRGLQMGKEEVMKQIPCTHCTCQLYDMCQLMGRPNGFGHVGTRNYRKMQHRTSRDGINLKGRNNKGRKSML
ncbi:hypothetical protein CAPTEDRAFT_202837 [Capitella teleta]|uniref:Uncharacterized protein n=1 Tax=Capitella teleta TaxID=283909 RepID=R7TAE2_CAPTE|nr:hypothetical protein CAPTEDRAFT_202837 [Capitella teleta]|eukprot:ELT87984.1 hypothetical protein CAPTEDRAFT_202837 [Capitella teleta]